MDDTKTLLVLVASLLFILILIVAAMCLRRVLAGMKKDVGDGYFLINTNDDVTEEKQPQEVPFNCFSLPIQHNEPSYLWSLKPRSCSVNSVSSSVIYEDEDFEIQNNLKDQERRISEGVLEHLKKQGRRRSVSDLRGYPVSKIDRSVSSEYFEKRRRSRSLDEDFMSSQKSLNEEDLAVDNTLDTSRDASPVKSPEEKPSTHQDTGSEVGPKMFRKTGWIEFTTEYFELESRLELHVKQVILKSKDLDERNISCFFKAFLLPGKRQRQQSSIIRETKKPLFNETMDFMRLKEQELMKYKLKIKVINQENLMRKNETLGCIVMALSSLNLHEKETFNSELFLQRSQTALTSVLISICHKAASSKLEVTISRVKNLPKAGVLGTYASVLLFKEKKMLRKETSIKRNTRDPNFNEKLELDVHTDITAPLSTHSIVVTINSQSMVGKDEVLGHVIFNNISPQSSATDHWKLVQESPYQNHTAWHSLLNPDEI